MSKEGFRNARSWTMDPLPPPLQHMVDLRTNDDGYVCPFCDHRHSVFEDDIRTALVTYHGTDGWIKETCDECGEKFEVKETVVRKFESKKIGEEE